MNSAPTIFISIAAYRDPELLTTLQDCISTAANPQALQFCIAWQHSPDDAWDNLDEFKSDSRFQIIDISFRDSKGTCWARHQIQKRYRGEDYTLQMDSHHRFVKNWDVSCITMIRDLQGKGFAKPILSTV